LKEAAKGKKGEIRTSLQDVKKLGGIRGGAWLPGKLRESRWDNEKDLYMG